MSRDVNPRRYGICSRTKQPSPTHVAFTSSDRSDVAGRSRPTGLKRGPWTWGFALPALRDGAAIHSSADVRTF
jgi:hypothetical protein